ncbi:sigma-70 family RNA polymerase sigma factor [Inquilinus sp. Marseille-Q2685]|uniref:sigma-70 family RNA polymerase sigma factor n=1 Tax=Inquilinus sp. Marseille-Q2685 TaxID=2866581 RepID=UPI001CE436E0|nr:sigma-70 family RNA polymerase sigma factor [Inquilinus sp. Marseille-Q2685]
MAEGAGEEALADADLLARIAAGDRRAFAVLMRRHGDRVRGLALGFGGRADEADDIAQDVFLMLWRRPDAWRPGQAAFTTWLYRVVANRCLDRARRRRLRRWLPFGNGPEPADDAPTALTTLSGRDRLAAVARLIRTLPERQRLALLLAVQGGRSNAEIAAILGISQGAAEQLLVRARRTLRAVIDERETRS